MAKTESIVLGGGCFWCLEAAYQRINGVIKVTSGYAGGETKDPTYEQVSSGNTGHTEVTLVEFDPEVITLADILEIFWTIHDPTTLNRQGNDVGTQYRSAIYYSGDAQKAVVDKSLDEASRIWGDKIVTEVKPLDHFYAAEEYHQNYYAKNPGAGYCQVVINPKLAKLREKFATKLKPNSVS